MSLNGIIDSAVNFISSFHLHLQRGEILFLSLGINVLWLIVAYGDERITSISVCNRKSGSGKSRTLRWAAARGPSLPGIARCWCAGRPHHPFTTKGFLVTEGTKSK